jgi:hypothetical protein
MNVSDIWNEYKYRHDLIWRKVHQFTIIMVSLGIAPYLKFNLLQSGIVLIKFLPLIRYNILCFWIDSTDK